MLRQNSNTVRPNIGARFALGQTFITPGAQEVLESSGETAIQFLRRHVSGDWGNLDDYDREQNAMALKGSGRLFSVYHTEAGKKFYVITEHDRSVTTVLLPEDY